MFQTVEYLKKHITKQYKIAIILGTGLGGLVKEMKIENQIDYSNIPGFPLSTVESHSGKLIFGRISNKDVIAMQGRFHFYEGYEHSKVTFPIPVFHQLGVNFLIVSNACGALNPQFRKTDIMIMTSHINLHFRSPLNDYPVYKTSIISHYYSKRLINLAESVAIENGLAVQKGVYASVQGPALETKAEYRAIRKFGADVVGMSTIPEVLLATQLGIECFGVSIITDEGFPDTLQVAKLEHILQAASIAEPKMTLLVKKFIEKLEY
jgi:purine-nucleoside phosphorylase